MSLISRLRHHSTSLSFTRTAKVPFRYRIPARFRAMATGADDLPVSSIPIFTTVSAYRAWRIEAFRANQTVGFVPTMGALHEGHLSLVRRSLAENDLTVVSIFVNPAQFAPHEDLATYPRTLPNDLRLLAAEEVQANDKVRKPSAIFLPSVAEMYPSGIVQTVSEQKGTFVEVEGYGHQMEGMCRRTFFRGVATVVTKLFNAIEPTNAYFGQKDIQQALLLKRMVRDLLLSHPEPQNLHIVPTVRDPKDGLALSSRNVHLTPNGRVFAIALRRALQLAGWDWDFGSSANVCLARADEIVEEAIIVAGQLDVKIHVEYIEMSDSQTFEPLERGATKDDAGLVILSGAMIVDNIRLIDNILLGDINGVFD